MIHSMNTLEIYLKYDELKWMFGGNSERGKNFPDEIFLSLLEKLV